MFTPKKKYCRIEHYLILILNSIPKTFYKILKYIETELSVFSEAQDDNNEMDI
jgi:hypothetical protein